MFLIHLYAIRIDCAHIEQFQIQPSNGGNLQIFYCIYLPFRSSANEIILEHNSSLFITNRDRNTDRPSLSISCVFRKAIIASCEIAAAVGAGCFWDEWNISSIIRINFVFFGATNQFQCRILFRSRIPFPNQNEVSMIPWLLVYQTRCNLWLRLKFVYFPSWSIAGFVQFISSLSLFAKQYILFSIS